MNDRVQSGPVEELEVLFDDEKYGEVRSRVAATFGDPTVALSLTQRGELHRLAGLAALYDGDDEGAVGDLAEAFRIDPLDRDGAAAYGQLLFQMGRVKDAARVFEMLFLNHGDELTENTRRVILTRMASFYLAGGAIRRARMCVDAGLERAPADRELLSLRARALEAAGEAEEAVSVRDELIAQTNDRDERAALCRAQANALDSLERTDEALTLLMQAYADAPSQQAFDALAIRLDATERIDDLADLYDRRYHDADQAERNELIEPWVQLLTERLERLPQAAAALELHHDAHPNELPPFERLTELLHEAEAWHELHDAYARMIRRVHTHDAENRQLLGILWRALGELCRTQLGEDREALYAYQMAYDYLEEPALQDTMVELTERLGTVEDAIGPLTDAFARDPRRLDIGERLGAAFLKAGQTDRGYLTLRLVAASGGGSERAREIVESFAARRQTRFSTLLTDEMRARFLRPDARMSSLRTILSVAYAIFNDLLSSDEDDYDLGSRDRLNVDEPLLFNTVYREICENLGLERRPRVYVYDGVSQMVNAFFERPTFLVPSRMLSGVPERKLRFIVAQRLITLEPPYFFAGVMAPAQLKLLLAAVIDTFRDDFVTSETPEMSRLKRHLERNMKDHWRAPLELAVNSLFENEALADVDRFLLDAAIESYRVGLVCCDAPDAAVEAMQELPAFYTMGVTPDIMAEIVAFSWSEEMVKIRSELGISIG